MLANIADGDTSKKLIVDNEDMLKKLKSYMLHNNTNLQVVIIPLHKNTNLQVGFILLFNNINL